MLKNRPRRSFRHFLRAHHGASIGDYALLLGLIAAVALIGIGSLGTGTKGMLNRTANALDGAGAESGGTSGAGAVDPGSFVKMYGGSSYDSLTDALIQSDGTVIAVGAHFNAGQPQPLIMKLDADGGVIWANQLSGGDSAAFYKVVADGTGYAVVGYTDFGSAGSTDGLFARFDASGGLIMQRALGTATFETLYDLQPTSGGWLLLGWGAPGSPFDGNDHIWLTKLNTDGTSGFSKIYGGSGSERAASLLSIGGAPTIIGATNSFGSGDWDIFFLPVNSDGTLPGNAKAIGSATAQFAAYAKSTSSGVLVGGDNFIAKLNASGAPQWSFSTSFPIRQAIEAGPDIVMTAYPGRLISTVAGTNTVNWARQIGAGSGDLTQILNYGSGNGFIAVGEVSGLGGAGQSEALAMSLKNDGTTGGSCTQLASDSVSLSSATYSSVTANPTVDASLSITNSDPGFTGSTPGLTTTALCGP